MTRKSGAEKRRRRTDKIRAQDRERQRQLRLRHKLLAAGFIPLELWVQAKKTIQAWLILKKLDEASDQPAPAMIIPDLERVVGRWADDQIARLKPSRP